MQRDWVKSTEDHLCYFLLSHGSWGFNHALMKSRWTNVDAKLNKKMVMRCWVAANKGFHMFTRVRKNKCGWDNKLILTSTENTWSIFCLIIAFVAFRIALSALIMPLSMPRSVQFSISSGNLWNKSSLRRYSLWCRCFFLHKKINIYCQKSGICIKVFSLKDLSVIPLPDPLTIAAIRPSSVCDFVILVLHDYI